MISLQGIEDRFMQAALLLMLQRKFTVYMLTGLQIEKRVDLAKNN